MPTRMLREGILSSDRVDRLNADEEIFYRRLMSVVDDYGRVEADARILRAKCYPLRVDRITIEQVEQWIVATAAAGLILVYQVEGKRYIEYSNLGKPRAEKSKFPAPNIQVNTSVSGAADVPYSNSVSVSSSYSVPSASAAASPQTPALSVEEWGQPDPEQLAQQLASELVPRHWFPSTESLSFVHLRLKLANAVNPAAHVAAIRDSHGRWCAQVDQARRTGSLPRSIENKAFEWWIKDGLYLQDPKFGASRLQQVASRGGTGRVVARLLSGGE